jgi:hypothetical protein
MPFGLGLGFSVIAIVDFAIAVAIVETLVLVLRHRRTGRGIAPADLLPNIAAGLCLMLALRAALAQAAWGWIVLPLAASGVAHALDLRRRQQAR